MKNKTTREIKLIRENAMLEEKLRRYEQLLKIIGNECQQLLIDLEPNQNRQNESVCESDVIPKCCEHCYYHQDSYCDKVEDCRSCEHTDLYSTCLCLTVGIDEPCPYFKEKDKNESIKNEPSKSDEWCAKCKVRDECLRGLYKYCEGCSMHWDYVECGCRTLDKDGPCPYFKEKDKTEPTEPLTAHWIICSDGYYPYCSNCKTEPKSGIMSKFCPECGKRMKDGR